MVVNCIALSFLHHNFYFCHNISLQQCVSSDVQCYIGTNSFLVGQNTTLTVRGGCEFVVNATSTITIEGNATVQAAAVQLTAQSNIFISGKVSTSGRGTTSGPGAPSGSELGRGGTYGGSGGMFACEQDYFYSCFTKQVRFFSNIHLYAFVKGRRYLIVITSLTSNIPHLSILTH